MKNEIEAACGWWTRHLPQHLLSQQQSTLFHSHLAHELELRCSSHWYLDAPLRGSAYRSVIYDARLDPSLESAARVAGIDKQVLYTALPRGVMWLNPGAVKFRLNGMFNDSMVIYSASASTSKGPTESSVTTTTTTAAAATPIAATSDELHRTSVKSVAIVAAASRARDDNSPSPVLSPSGSPGPSVSPTMPLTHHHQAGFLLTASSC